MSETSFVRQMDRLTDMLTNDRTDKPRVQPTVAWTIRVIKSIQLPLTPRHFKGLEIFMPYRRVALLPFWYYHKKMFIKYTKKKLIYSYKIIIYSHIFNFHFYCVFPLAILEVLYPLLFGLQRTKAEKSQKLVNKSYTNIIFFFKDIFLNHVFKIHFKRILKMRSYFWNIFIK